MILFHRPLISFSLVFLEMVSYTQKYIWKTDNSVALHFNYNSEKLKISNLKFSQIKANTNFHFSFFSQFSSISKMKKIVPPPLHQNHFSSTSVKTRRKSSFLPRVRNLSSPIVSNAGNHMLLFFLLSCFMKTIMLASAIENPKDTDLHPLIILPEGSHDQAKHSIFTENHQQVEAASLRNTKREGRQYSSDSLSRQKKSSEESRQQSPQDLVSGKSIIL